MTVMDMNEILLHYRAAREYGQESACGKKVKFDNEEQAKKIAAHLNSRPEVARGERHRQEAYPCPFCFKWHTGREMSLEERKKWRDLSDGQLRMGDHRQA